VLKKELAERQHNDGVTANAVLPRLVDTNLGKNSGSRLQAMMFGLMRSFQTSAQKAAETLLYLASSKEVEGRHGEMLLETERGRHSAILA
jgi:NAD(P)-dependent dehydrogenase (short-subunit alcohol dehydrogenase family)